MKYYGLSEIDVMNPDAEKVSFYSLVLLFITMAVFFLLIGIGFNFLYGVVLFLGCSLGIIFLFYMRGADERNLNKALVEIPIVEYLPVRVYSVNGVLKDLDDRIRKLEA